MTDGYLFWHGKLCIPHGSMWEMLVQEAYAGGLSTHFGDHRTLEALKEHFYWLGMTKDVHKVVKSCSMCKQAKIRSELQGLTCYYPFLWNY